MAGDSFVRSERICKGAAEPVGESDCHLLVVADGEILTGWCGCWALGWGWLFAQAGRAVELGDLAGAVELMADVVVPDDFAVGGVEEGGGLWESLGVALGLGEDVLGAKGEFFGFDDGDDLAVEAEGVAGGFEALVDEAIPGLGFGNPGHFGPKAVLQRAEPDLARILSPAAGYCGSGGSILWRNPIWGRDALGEALRLGELPGGWGPGSGLRPGAPGQWGRGEWRRGRGLWRKPQARC